MDSQNIDFGDWVKQIREGEGWNQEELAQKLGVAQSYLSRIERGERPPTEPFCIALSAAFNFPIYTVLVRAGLVKDDEEFAAANALKTINEREDADVWEFKRRIKKIKNKEDREQALDNIRIYHSHCIQPGRADQDGSGDDAGMNDSNRLVLLFDPAWAARQAGVAVIVQGVGAVIFAAVTILLKEVLPSSEWRYVAGLAAVALFLVLLFRALGSRRFRGTLWNTTPMFVTTTALRRTVEELREMLPKLQQIAGDTRRLQVRNNHEVKTS